MADFKQAIQWLKEEKKVRRKDWKGSELENTGLFLINKSGVCHKVGNSTEYFNLNILDFEAKDWEVYCEEHEFKFNIGAPNEECIRCGIEKPKESLSDFIGEKAGITDHMLNEHKVKEKIQNAQNRLKKELYLTFESSGKIDKIFKEEFGEDLL